MRHEMLTQRALLCYRANTKRGTLSQHFVTHVVPPLASINRMPHYPPLPPPLGGRWGLTFLVNEMPHPGDELPCYSRMGMGVGSPQIFYFYLKSIYNSACVCVCCTSH